MPNIICKFLLTITVTAPTFLSFGLIGLLKNDDMYCQTWCDIFRNGICPADFEWWGITLSFVFMIVSVLGIKYLLKNKSQKCKESKSIKVNSYSNLSPNGAEQIVSSIMPWLSMFIDQHDYLALFVCILIPCFFIALASYNNTNYNLIYSILGYRYYEVKTDENTYVLLSAKCIKNKNDIKNYAELTDYMGLIIN